MLLDCMHVHAKIYLICVKLFKNATKICYSKQQCVSASLLGDFVPQTSYQGTAPGPRWGTSIPQTPRLCSSKISFKNPLPITEPNPNPKP